MDKISFKIRRLKGEEPSICGCDQNKQILFQVYIIRIDLKYQSGENMIKLQVLLLVVAAQALNLGHKQTQTYYNATNYLSDLEARQAQFKTDINSIKSQIDQINKALNSSIMTPSQQLRILSQGTADERDSLYNIETYLNMPFETEPCRPCNITTVQKEALQKQVQSVKQSIINLESQVDFCPECPQIKEIKLEVEKQKNYIKVIQATLNSNCLPKPYEFQPEDPSGLVNLANSLYKDNLKATNWIYGNITEDQYRMYLFTLATQYNLTSCPLSAPYVDSTSKRCYACAGTYSVGEKKCYPCPTDQHYNSTTSKCEQNPKICPAGTTLNATTNNCDPILCPPGQKYNVSSLSCSPICGPTQYFNTTTSKCEVIPITCPAGTAFNSTSGKCEAIKCGVGMSLNMTTNKCEPIQCPNGQYYNTTTLKCENIVCPSGQIYDFVVQKCVDKVTNTLGLCPPTKPYWNSANIRCEPCPPEYPLYNGDNGRCQQCPVGQVWNNNSAQCENGCANGLIWNSVAKRCQGLCSNGQVWNSTTSKCQGSCPSGQFWNSTTSKCQGSCPSGQTWDSISNKCIPICPEGTILNPSTNSCQTECPPNTTLNKVTNRCQPICGPGTKYNATSGVCQVVCEAGYAYNPATKKCETICRANSVWDSARGGCVCNIGYYSNGTDCLLIVIDRNCSVALPIWNQAKKQCQACPADKPNYSPSSKLCVSACPTGYIWSNETYNCQLIKCSQPTPLLNLTTGKCTACPASTSYSATQKNCVKQINYTCPSGYLFNNITKQCEMMYCPEGYHLNIFTLKCEKCADGAYYNVTAQQCYKCPGGSQYNTQKGYCDAISCAPGTYASLKQNKCVAVPACSDKEYFSVAQESCVVVPNCGLNQVFNLSSLKCELSASSCSSGYYFNTSTSQCQPYSYVTSPSSPSLIYTYPFQNYIDQYNARLKSDPSARDCPSATPYFDQKNKFCVNCPKQYPYFNLHTNLCQDCGSGGYDTNNRKCSVEKMNLGPTLERLIMNIL